MASTETAGTLDASVQLTNISYAELYTDGGATPPATEPGCVLSAPPPGSFPPQLCVRLDADTAARPVEVAVDLTGPADEHGTSDEFRRRLTGRILNTPATVQLAQTGDSIFDYYADTNPDVYLQADIGWDAALDVPVDPAWGADRNFHGLTAVDSACDPAAGCRPTTPQCADRPGSDHCASIAARPRPEATPAWRRAMPVTQK